jgi:hypothetical protein
MTMLAWLRLAPVMPSHESATDCYVSVSQY